MSASDILRQEAKTAALGAVEDAESDVGVAIVFLEHSVKQARQAGATWEDIGNTLGISKQAAWERFSK